MRSLLILSTAALAFALAQTTLIPALGELKTGDTLGNFALLAEGEHLLSALAATDVELAVLERDAFESLRKQKPQASLKLMLALAQDFGERLRDAGGPLREFLTWQVSKRQADGR